MQIRHPLSQLRQKLLGLYSFPREDLAPFLSDYPLIRGTLYTLRRKCSKPSCRCVRGERHEAVVLTASMSGKTRLWTIPAERVEEIRQRTENHRQFRRARAHWVKEYAKRQAEMLRIIDRIEKTRTQIP